MAIVEVVKYNGGPDVFVWKYPNEELGTWTQLIVNEAQEAILFKGGKALDIFGSGRHTLETANIPLLNKLVNLPFGGRSPFAAEVWFINRTIVLDVKWGTASPIQIQDPKYKVFVPVRAFGQFGIQIEDSKKFLVKLVGTMPQFDKVSLIKYFRGLYLTKVKDNISTYLIHQKISVLEINAYLDEISSSLQEKMRPFLEEYGIRLVSFYVNDINIPEEDSAVIQLKAALAKRAEMDIVGYSYQQERSFDTLEGAATNPSSMQGGLMGAGIGLGMGMGVGGTMGSQFGGLAQNLSVEPSKRDCPGCGAPIDMQQRFCGKCGLDTQSTAASKNTCSACGTALALGVRFCPDCGKRCNPCPNCKAELPESGPCPACGYDPSAVCPGCGAALPKKGAKFCPECGQKLARTCSGCGADISGSPKFCPECGNKLQEAGQ